MVSKKSINIYIPKYLMAVINCINILVCRAFLAATR